MNNPRHWLAFGGWLLIGAAQAQSPYNLLHPTNGGTIVRFTAPQVNVAGLIDPSKRNPPASSEAKFPQDIVFAFRDDSHADVASVTIKPDARVDKVDWPKRVAIAVSTNNPLDGFEETGVLSLEQEATEQELNVGRSARYLRLRVLENFGGKRVSLGEVKAMGSFWERPRLAGADRRPAGQSGVLDETPRTATGAIALPKDSNEPNDTPGEATKIQFSKEIRGAIDPPGEFDYFSFSLPGSSPRVVTMTLQAKPNIRTSVALMRGRDVVKEFDPSRAAVERAELSWLVESGDYFVRMTEPPISMVLIWDSSSSMRGSEEALKRGVEAFISHVQPPDRLQLIQFAGQVEPFTTNFSSDAAELQALFKARYKLTSGTACFDAIQTGIQKLDGVAGNRAIVVMTDGADTQSKIALTDFWKLLEEKRIRLYTIGLGKETARFMDKTGNSARRTLAHLADATNGRFFMTENAGQLLNLYEEISRELRSVSEYQFIIRPSSGEGTLSVSATAGQRIVTNALAPMEIIFDASGSMREKVGGRRKIEIMKQVIPQVVDAMPPQQQVALRIYGHRISSQTPAARTDSELVLPLGTVDKEQLKKTINELSPRGTTPIAYSLQQLPKDFANVRGAKTVVLVTDGREEAGGDPIKVVRDLLTSGFEFKLSVIGFALGDRESKQQMQTIAEMTGGKFYDAASAAGLRDAVERSVIEETLSLPFMLLDAAGAEVASGITGNKTVAVPEGVFTLRVQTGPKPLTISNIRIAAKSSTRVQLAKEGAEFTTRVE